MAGKPGIVELRIARDGTHPALDLNGRARFGSAHPVSGTGIFFPRRAVFTQLNWMVGEKRAGPDCRRIALGHLAGIRFVDRWGVQ